MSLDLGTENKTELLPNCLDENTSKQDIFDKLQSKSVGTFVIDVFKLKDPLPIYKVRGKNKNFIQVLANKMIEKKAISIENAANVIGTVQVDKSAFNEEMLSSYDIYVIDGNHNVQAQKLAFERTENVVFKFRVIRLFCNLTQEEALILGTSCNEDASTILKVSDYEKVDLIRRYLYLSTKTKEENDPPEPNENFTDTYKQLLNLKTVIHSF